uniref:Uncharacterized protein n=1 Tax=Arion vulgaris TaxID=1028688 RepID=A0A0B7AXW3_9EUPU
MPIRAVAVASINNVTPQKVWYGMYMVRAPIPNFGHKNEKKPKIHCNPKLTTTKRPSQLWRE